MDFMNILMTAVNAVLPIILLILLGYLLRQKGFLSGDFVKQGNKLVFHVCLPCMLFVNVYDIDGFSSIRWELVIYACAMVAVMFLLGLVTACSVTKVPQRRGVITQCAFRSNMAIIGLSLAAALGGQDAVAVAAVVSAFTIPIFNVLAVVSLSVFTWEQGKEKRSVKGILLNIAKNPLIIGVALGMVCLGIRALQNAVLGELAFSLRDDAAFLYKALVNLKSIASPFALIVLGGQFTFSAVKGIFREIAAGTLLRLVLAPLLGIGFAILLTNAGVLHCGPNEYPALIALFGSPVAVSSAVMAGQMGADEQLATQLVVWTSVCSILTVILQTCILIGMGLLAV